MGELPDGLADEPFCYLTTTGRRSGHPHEIEIWFGLRGVTVFVLSGGGTRSDWVRNLLGDPRVRVRIRGGSWSGRARAVTERNEEEVARRLLATKYQEWREGKPMSGWARTALPIAVELEP